MELLGDLGLGFATALSPFNLMYCFIGVLLGTAVGVLPGLGPVATIAMLLPITFGLPPVSSLIMRFCQISGQLAESAPSG